jgi:hypothetical protein
MPIGTLRLMADKVLGGVAIADDYLLYAAVIADCSRRSPLAEVAQRELDSAPGRHEQD